MSRYSIGQGLPDFTASVPIASAGALLIQRDPEKVPLNHPADVGVNVGIGAGSEDDDPIHIDTRNHIQLLSRFHGFQAERR